jgi:hypothetical protein
MQMETKFLRLRTPVTLGSRFGDWQVCWLGGWARFRLYFLVMLVKAPLRRQDLSANRTIDLALGVKRAMNGVAMNTFTIDSDNNITAHAGLPADADKSSSFASQKELAKLTAAWPIARLVETWNSFAGMTPFADVKPVKKFTDRKAAVARIWTAVERMVPLVAAPASPVAPAQDTAKKPPAKSKRRDTPRHAAKKAANVAREGSKKSEVIDLMRRSQGATLAEVMELTGWQAHTIRGFVSGTLIKKLGLNVESFRSNEKERTYRIK